MTTLHIYSKPDLKHRVSISDGIHYTIDELIQMPSEKQSKRFQTKVEQINNSTSCKKSKFDVPIYTLLSESMYYNLPNNKQSPKNMATLLLLYKEVEEIQQSNNIDTIYLYGISGRYYDILTDLCEKKNLALVSQTQTDERPLGLVTISNLIWYVLSLLDIPISLMIQRIRTTITDNASDSNILLEYPLFREDTLDQSEKNFDFLHDKFVMLLGISYLSHGLISNKKPLKPIRSTGNMNDHLSELNTIKNLYYSIIIKQEIQRNVTGTIEDIVSVNIPRTVENIIYDAFHENIKTIVWYICMRNIIKSKKYDVIILTSYGKFGKAIALAADNIADVHLIPHSIMFEPITGLEKLSAVYCEGHIVNKVDNANNVNFIPTGLPKHQSIKNNTRSCKNTKNQVILTTQPINDTRRKKFVCDVCSAVLRCTGKTVVIKTHPEENKSFYQNIVSNKLSEYNSRITISDEKLDKHIVESEYLITICSNTGIESIILGTPTIIYNPYEPDLPTPLYSTKGPVPRYTTGEEVVKCIRDNDSTTLLSEQARLLYSMYNIINNDVEKIYDHINNIINKE